MYYQQIINRSLYKPYPAKKIHKSGGQKCSSNHLFRPFPSMLATSQILMAGQRQLGSDQTGEQTNELFVSSITSNQLSDPAYNTVFCFNWRMKQGLSDYF